MSQEELQFNGRVNIAGLVPQQKYNMINQKNNETNYLLQKLLKVFILEVNYHKYFLKKILICYKI